MSALFISLLTLVLILISVFVVFLVLMQKPKRRYGISFGGGMAESAFGSIPPMLLTRATIYTTIAFFIIALILYLMYQTNASDQKWVGC